MIPRFTKAPLASWTRFARHRQRRTRLRAHLRPLDDTSPSASRLLRSRPHSPPGMGYDHWHSFDLRPHGCFAAIWPCSCFAAGSQYGGKVLTFCFRAAPAPLAWGVFTDIGFLYNASNYLFTNFHNPIYWYSCAVTDQMFKCLNTSAHTTFLVFMLSCPSFNRTLILLG